MSRAVLFHGPGQPLELARFAVPQPLGEEVLVRVTCCTLCRSDLHTHAGRRHGPTPTVLGHEIVGRIEAFGPSAPRVDLRGFSLTLGDRVTWTVAASCGRCFFCADDLPQKCEHLYKYGHQRATVEKPFNGGLADHVMLVGGTRLLCLPEEVPDAVAAPMNCATATVAAVLRHAGIISGRNVLILGAGMLGLTACAMARVGGARSVIVSDPEPSCLQRAAGFGATHLFPAADSADATDTTNTVSELAERIAEITSGRSADVVLELAGARESVETALSLARVGCTLVLAGTVSPVHPVAIDPEKVVRQMLTIRGVHNYHPLDLVAALTFVVGRGREFPFASLVGRSFPLEQAEQAFEYAHAHPGSRVAVVP